MWQFVSLFFFALHFKTFQSFSQCSEIARQAEPSNVGLMLKNAIILLWIFLGYFRYLVWRRKIQRERAKVGERSKRTREPRAAPRETFELFTKKKKSFDSDDSRFSSPHQVNSSLVGESWSLRCSTIKRVWSEPRSLLLDFVLSSYKLSQMDSSEIVIKDIKNLLERDQYLRPFEKEVRRR